MKKILIGIAILFSFVGAVTYADNHTGESTGVSSVKVKVTEKVPGARCTGGETSGIWECDLGTGFGPIMTMIGRMITYATFIASLAGVLFIIINGILYSMSGMDAGMKDEAKKRIVKTLLGLVVLLLSGLILNLIAPWIYVV